MSPPRHPAFKNSRSRNAIDPSPNALTRDEVIELQDKLHTGAAPRMFLIRKMLRLSPKVVCQPTQASFKPPQCRVCGEYPCVKVHP